MATPAFFYMLPLCAGYCLFMGSDPAITHPPALPSVESADI